MSATPDADPSNLSIQLNECEREMIAQAAKASNTTVSDFVLQTAYAEAQAILAGQTRFQLSEERWQELCAALDSPPRDIPALRKLLTEPGVFDG